jgi:hypothetical protein
MASWDPYKHLIPFLSFWLVITSLQHRGEMSNYSMSTLGFELL